MDLELWNLFGINNSDVWWITQQFDENDDIRSRKDECDGERCVKEDFDLD